MTHPHVLDQLPLWVEGDLTAPELEAVERHLAACPACREAADQLRQSQAWLREALASPFGAEDRARLRASVMARLAAPPPAPRRFLVPSALLAAAAVLVVAVLTWNRPQGKPAPLPTAGTGPEFTSRATAGATDIPAPAPPLPPRVRLARAAHAQAQLQVRQRPDGTALPRREPARLEFQTADPTIRIIWLAQATPLPDPNPTLEETP
ncbi:MAG: putative zinc-finger [Holophagaceae bacterium]|nr:putative zinc-finger [Holophagaceae bacterium]